MPGIKEKTKEIAFKNGASLAGITDVLKSADLNKVLSLIENAPPGLSYLKSNISKRLDIREWYPETKSVLLCAWQYWNSSMDYDGIISGISDYSLFFEKNSRKPPSSELLKFNRDNKIPVKISRYALSRDYHKTIKKKLKAVLKEIKIAYPDIDGRFFVDTSPVFEKKLAALAGLGWQGKNSLIINEDRGSYFFIGGIALSVYIKPDKAARNLCADCNLCVKHCPTGALDKSGIIDANKCLSYWTTQNKNEIPSEIKEKSGGNIFGCDICQEACPFNNNIKEIVDKEFLL